MAKYRLTLRCLECDHKFKRIVTTLDQPDPPCPKCKKKARKPRGMDFNSTRAPSVGGSIMTQAIDETSRIVMQDHGMTNLRDRLREGEIMAPSLPPAQQAKVDNFWGGPRKQRLRESIPQNLQPAHLGQAALGGAYRGQNEVSAVLASRHKNKMGLKTNVVASDRPKVG